MQQIRPASYPRIDNLLLILANTEYKFSLNPRTNRFMLRARESVPFKLSFAEGESGINYLDIFSSETWTEEEVYGEVTLYMQSPNAGTTIEILQWIQK